MIIIEKNEGTKIPYEVSGKRITFDDDLSLNLAKQEKDWPVHIDICVDGDGNLCNGTGAGLYYVAQIDIPAAVYNDEQVRQPLDMDTVTLTLWSIDELTESTDE
jgi:hypothetical protein